ncbi:MAG: hypothetical protein Q7O66_21520 [Dehalococcoidia bacterium]|nr:hypothetical protein [Dehalococcoidia bacterium]
MAHVDELQKKYPNLPREIIVKWEMLRNGVRDSDVLSKEGTWRRPAGDFLSHDRGVTMEETAKKRPETVRQGYLQIPGQMFMRNGIGARVMRDSRSPYQIREESPGKYALYEGKARVENAYFNPPNHWTDEPDKEPRTSKGTPITSLITRVRRCFFLAPLRYCDFLGRGEGCKFCNYNATHDQAVAAGNKHAVALNLEETVEAYKLLASEVKLIEGRFQSGAISDVEKEANQQFRFLERIASGASYKPHIAMSSPPMSRKNMQRLKDAGLDGINSNIEVWDRELFAEVCPGKARHRGYDTYLQTQVDAVDVFGAGYVSCNFVGGVTQMPENGHKTWQEGRDSLIEGLRWLIRKGVFATFHCVWLGAGSTYGDDPSSPAKIPPTEYFLDAGLAHHEACLETGLYKKLDKLLSCPMCFHGFYSGEIGMIALAGDLGNWIADAIPADANWMARFISSMKEAQPSEGAKMGNG